MSLLTEINTTHLEGQHCSFVEKHFVRLFTPRGHTSIMKVHMNIL